MKGKTSREHAFREAYSKLSILRSMCKGECISVCVLKKPFCISSVTHLFSLTGVMFCFMGIPLLAITGTADKATQKNIVQLLAMSKNMVNIFVSVTYACTRG